MKRHRRVEVRKSLAGFALAEFLNSTVLLVGLSGAVFGALTDMQHTAAYQSEVQAVLNNSRIAMQTIERHIRQAGNDPLGTEAAGITIMGPEELKVRADLTGSDGPGSPDKGDPDGDIGDSSESVTIRYNNRTRSLEIMPEGGSAQIVAGYIAGLSFEYFDAQDRPTVVNAEVRRIDICLKATSLLPDPRTGQFFGLQVNRSIQILA